MEVIIIFLHITIVALVAESTKECDHVHSKDQVQEVQEKGAQ